MRTLVTKWQDFEAAHSEGDRLSIIVRDERTGKLKHISATIYDVDHEGEAGWEEMKETWGWGEQEFGHL